MQKTTFKFFILIFLTCSSISKAKESPKFKDVTILVSSCDKYAELWDPFFTLLFKNWPDLNTINQDVPIVLISNKIAYLNPRVKNMQIPNEKSWSDNILEALKHVKTKYVLYLQDDYFITSLDTARLHSLMKVLSQEHIACIQISSMTPNQLTGKPYPNISGVQYKGQFDEWRTSLQAAIWSKEDLKLLLKPGESGWDFESPGNVRSQGIRNHFLLVSEHSPVIYLNMCNRGYIEAEALQAINALGVDIKNRTLPLDKDHKFARWYKLTLPKILYYDIVVPCKNLFIRWFG
jgi:hypothetical protein